MASFGNEIAGWTQRRGGRGGEVAEPVTSPEDAHHPSPVKSTGSTARALQVPGGSDPAHSTARALQVPGGADPAHSSAHSLQVPGGADPAHSSARALQVPGGADPAHSTDHALQVPGGAAPAHSSAHALQVPGGADPASSSFPGGSDPGCPPRSCPGQCCRFPPDPAPYMDWEYVRGIYNLGADPRAPQPQRAAGLSTPPSSPSLPARCGIAPTPGTFKQAPLAAAPPSPPARLDSYNTSRHPESCRGGQSSGGHGGCEGQPAPGVQDSRLEHRDEPPERDERPAGEKALEHKGLSSDSTEVSTSNIQGSKTGGSGEWSPPQQPTKRSNPHIFSRPSSFIFQEYLKTDSMANVPKMLSAYNSVHAYKIPSEMSCRSSHPAPSNPNTLNDTQEVKQCPWGLQKPSALPSTVPGPSQGKGSLPCAQDLLCAQWHPDVDQDVFEDSCDLKRVENALLIKNASRKLNSCTDKNQCYDSGGKIGRDVRGPVLNQQGRVQRSAVSCSCQAVGAEHPQHEDLDQAREQSCGTNSHVASLRPREESTSGFVPESQEGKQANNSNPDLSTCLEQEDPPVQKHQPGFQTQLSRQLWEGCAGEQISRQVTPMLYHLSGGKPTGAPHPPQLPPSQEDSRCVQVQRDPRCHPEGSADQSLLQSQDHTLGSPAALTEESFQDDYREKLKEAQKKVLRETSFKRKDLQMSLPVRLRQKPSKRPSIEHLRSFSLSSANEDAKAVLCSPSHLESLESFSKDEEIQKPQTGRVGGRKRVTKEEKKLCYSEPEKLDQLMDKEVSWSQVQDEITEQDIVAARTRALENGGRNSSSVSRTELKQIQQTALMEYMERKISQRPGGSQHLPLHKPPLQKRLSHPKGPPGKISNPNGSRKMQNDEVFHQVFSREKSPDAFPALALAAPPSVSRGDPSKAQGSCPSNCPAAESLPQAGDPAAGGAPGRSKSTPPSPRDTSRCASGAAAPAQSWESHESRASSPSFHDPEEDGSKKHGHNDITGHACFQDAKELTPETSIPIPRSGSEEGAGAEEECRTPGGNAALKALEQHPGAPPEQGRCSPPALAQPVPAARNAGLSAQEDPALERGMFPRRRLRSPHDQRHRELALQIVAKDRSLGDVLLPDPDRKTALDLLEGLFPVNIPVLDESPREKGSVQHVQENDGRKSHGDIPEECPESEHEAKPRSKESTSEGHQVLARSSDSTDDTDDITSKKLELMGSLRARLRSLWQERELVLRESRDCAARGRALEAAVRELCKPNELERYLMFIGDLEKVVSLLLCLSSRLARVQNALSRAEGSADAEEKHALSERHQLLSRQQEDAKDLKENLDRRERVVSGILAKYLTEQQLQDYRHFVQVKTSLLIEQKDLEEQIKLFEEQLETLEQSIRL